MGASTASLAPAARSESAPQTQLFFLSATSAFVTSICALLPVFYTSARGWMTDPLRSIGATLPIAAVLFLWREIRLFPRPMQGKAYGLVLVTAAVGVVELLQRYALQLFLSRKMSFDPLPSGLAISLMAAGLLVLLGGWQLLRRCIFPVVLLGITNPVPHVFSDYLDLPLQRMSADAARHFAFLIGEHPTGEQLRLMFTPDFGMFIAPGCNGIRGAVTLGYLGLFAGVWRRWHWTKCVMLLCAGVLCGYLFNFLRLFVLVVYYKLGQSFPRMQPYGTQVDYMIGGTLFLLASFAIGSIVFSKKEGSSGKVAKRFGLYLSGSSAKRLFALSTLICAIPAAANVRTMMNDRLAAHPQEIATSTLPEHVGGFHIVRQWFERSEEGITVYHWGQYTDGNPADDVSLGLWLPLSEHDVRYSHATRGESLQTMLPLWHTAPGLGTVAYSAYRYNEGPSSIYLASLECRACRGSVPGVEHWLGPLLIVSKQRVAYFRAPLGRSAVLTHSAPIGTDDQVMRRPLEDFLSGLNERTLFHELSSHSLME